MKRYFPEMYNAENFFLYIKLITEKRVTKLGSLQKQIHTIEINSEAAIKPYLDDNFKMVWDCKRLKSEEGIFIFIKFLFVVDNFLYVIEKLWPLGDYVWSQESALEYLSVNDYKIENTIQDIQENSEKFKKFLDSNFYIKKFVVKKLNRDFHRQNLEFDNRKNSKRRIRYK